MFSLNFLALYALGVSPQRDEAKRNRAVLGVGVVILQPQACEASVSQDVRATTK